MKNLNARAWLALAVLAVVMGLLLFVPAGTVHYWQAWVYLSIFMGASVLTTLYLMRKDPALLERRMSGGPTAEKQPAQKFIMLCMSIGFIALLVVPALDHRFGWSTVPLGGVVAGDVLVVIGFYLISLVYRENTFTSAIIEVAENQKVIATGPYAIVRHPMYASASLYLLGTPLALGSYWGLVPVAAMMPFLIWRLFDEERFLARNLPGYTEYQKRVRHRLVPFVGSRVGGPEVCNLTKGSSGRAGARRRSSPLDTPADALERRFKMNTAVTQGGCLCGAIRYQANGPPSSSMVCHCRTCRQAAGAPLVAWLTFPAESFSFVRGQPAEFRSSTPVTRTFCSSCGTPLTYIHTERPGEIDVTTSTMDDPEAFPPSHHAWVSHTLSWLHVNDGLPVYSRTSKEE